MIERHYGWSEPPFRLSPDPQAYFDSPGHAQVLSYLRYGVMQAEGFIVVSGEIGAGKTTLVRKLLGELEGSDVEAAEVVSTQLDDRDLLQSIAQAFGVADVEGSKARMLGALEAHFLALMLQGKRALLIVDEAQHLSFAGLEELRMLSNFQSGSRTLFQSFLVGQPALRTRLRSGRLEQLRQRITASCHLGALSPDQTQDYLRFRLQRVGWKGQPVFEPDAMARIHAVSRGIPRRIHLLCSRVLLREMLHQQGRIDGHHVDEAQREMHEEAGQADAYAHVD